MNNVRRQARNARITTERDQPLGLDPLLRCRRWADERLEKPDDERRDVESLPEQNNAHALPSRIEAAHMHSDPEIVMIISAPESLSPIPTIEQIARPQPAGNLDAEKTTSSIVGQKHPRHRFPQSAAEAKPTCELNTAIEHQRSHAPSSVHLVKQIVAIFCSSWLSVLLPFIPAGFASNYTNSPPILNFILNFFAIFPSASIVDMAMDEVMLHFGNTIGVLMYMTFGNIVQLVTSILLLKTRQVEILKTSLVGGILSRVLLIMGASYFAGGINRLQQSFDDTKNVAKQTIKGVAEGTVTESQPSPPSIVFSKNEVLEPRLSMTTGIITLIIGTVVLAFNTTFAVDSIDGLTADHASPTFIGLILLPFLDNDLMPIKCARMDKLDLSIMASAGKSLQTSLLITPLIVIIAWIWGIDDMGLLFDGFQVASLFMAVLIFNFLIATGKSN
ncbi:hypothetical protein SS1G_09377 [Sclerotinia sclerotiorum 1980 UF-70]|uniref:Sodium/calcium exchanger membrane region domain-containing protein n=1 Tax=Sclerotinia sclerotiorum (strain ATCC 18683 / 1980 / Ss-1) TaxID=665079 RepID=A7EVL8_SCLS1|nr:hypothetical protein SS1G_09377 [Sclerotinia sclerotiorum 1980 UF-70]EDN93510.1 hypothetical protein SS1G_09377 [Sclerotinia sclerotiorum 1980 UF-70]